MNQTLDATASLVSQDFSKPFALLVEDHPLFRKGLSDFLTSSTDLAFCVEADSITSGLARFQEHRPTIVLIDISLYQENGLHLVSSIRTLDPTMPILVISMFQEELYADRAIKAGATGYVSKQASYDVILHAFETVRKGKAFRAFKNNPHPVELLTGIDQNRMQELSAREQQILQFLGDGLTSQAIANKLSLATSTVETYRERIKTKLKITNSAELLRYAILWRLNNP